MPTAEIPDNPFRDDLATRQSPEPCTLVIFGATGDLTHKLLIPALYNLALDGELPPTLKIVAFARRPKTSEGMAARLLILTSIRSVQRFLGANSSR